MSRQDLVREVSCASGTMLKIVSQVMLCSMNLNLLLGCYFMQLLLATMRMYMFVV
jgi:hypothetical protein